MAEHPTESRIVVGVDGSPDSVAALHWAMRQAVLTGASVDAVGCWQRPQNVGYPAASHVDADLAVPTGDDVRAAVRDAVAATTGGAEVTVQARAVEGAAAAVLVQEATDADLLVVGSRGHGELAGMLLGSVGLHCATHAPCPVLIVHEAAGRQT